MYLDKAKKEEIFSKYGKSNSDTGSAESQIALFSYRIAHLTEHVKKNRKDYTTTRATSIAIVLSSRPSVFVSNQRKQTHCLTEQNPIARKNDGIFRFISTY